MKNKKSKNLIISFKLKLRHNLTLALIALIITTLIFYGFMAVFVNPIIKKTGISKISEKTGESISSAIFEAMKGTITYDDLIHIVTDSSGKITMLQANSIQINSLSRKVIEKTYSELLSKLSSPLQIPLGTFTGLPIFSGVGPNIEISSKPYASVSCNFLSRFLSAGINQTVHQIYISVSANITMILPFVEVSSLENTEVLVSESLIIGEIPATYLMAEEKADLLNMVG